MDLEQKGSAVTTRGAAAESGNANNRTASVDRMENTTEQPTPPANSERNKRGKAAQNAANLDLTEHENAASNTANPNATGQGIVSTPLVATNTQPRRSTTPESAISQLMRHDLSTPARSYRSILSGSVSPNPEWQMPAEAAQFEALQRTMVRLTDKAKSDLVDTLGRSGLEVRLNRVEQVWNNANVLCMDLLPKLEDPQLRRSYEETLALMEEDYFETAEVYSTAIDRFAQMERNAQTANQSGPQDERPINVIAKMAVQQHDIANTWGEFDGSFRKWMEFRDRFKEAIHLNPDISDAYKYSYLKKSLVGKAAKVLGDVQLTNDSYKDAYERLHQLYDKPYLISCEYMKQFERLPELNGIPTANELHKMTTVTSETMRQLKALGHPIEHWDMVFVYGLYSRLDAGTRKEWSLQRTSEFPKIKDMLKFLDRQASALENFGLERSGRRQSQATATGGGAPRRSTQRDASNHSSRSSSIGTGGMGAAGATYQRTPGLCEACSTPGHFLFHCPEFSSLNLNARKDFVSRRRICPNCLRKGHGKDSCTAVRCSLPQCRNDPAHNSMLCPVKQQLNRVMTVANPSSAKKHKGTSD